MKLIKAVGYWFLQLTWGCLMTIPGLIVLLFCITFLKPKIHKNGYSLIIEIGGNWGGLNLGAISLCGGYTTVCESKEWFEQTRKHEYGHSLQNIIFGPFMIFLVGVPSVIRYYYQSYRYHKGLENKDYDSIWFERTATKWGTKVINRIEKEI